MLIINVIFKWKFSLLALERENKRVILVKALMKVRVEPLLI